MSKDDICKLLETAYSAMPDLFVMPEAERLVVYAYSLSKMTIAIEMDDYEKYNKMLLVEFYEFIGRWAYLIFQKQQVPLA